ncbi:molybdate ABC transporter permease subunit [Thiospirochaeta perfilievii]|uniref:Molybdenum transport system permease n=1 Tax=Thiospirochaeta perfilievii TaxID=252967 RepID=A0A5C1QFV7_9SPIO|nr:molybdate ABC transporter permease subunit [Thiospirochaeta perfilievii]QEN05959.1 molybdate ABC transporter permease subunit [Thiospirochaeta perfilievii]
MDYNELITTILLSVKMATLATIINLPIALFISLIITKGDFHGKSLLDGVINLPLVMPPVTIGYLLLIILGKNGLVGSIIFKWFNIRVAFTPAAVVITSMVVSFPLIYKSIKISLEMLDKKLEGVAKTLGASRYSILLRVTLPQIIPGIINGVVLGFARCLGEFGATMTFAGNISGVTRTIPLAVYSKLQIPGEEGYAALLVTISILISFLALVISNIFEKKIKKRGN